VSTYCYLLSFRSKLFLTFGSVTACSQLVALQIFLSIKTKKPANQHLDQLAVAWSVHENVGSPFPISQVFPLPLARQVIAKESCTKDGLKTFHLAHRMVGWFDAKSPQGERVVLKPIKRCPKKYFLTWPANTGAATTPTEAGGWESSSTAMFHKTNF
jgi:hypothetical protein